MDFKGDRNGGLSGDQQSLSVPLVWKGLVTPEARVANRPTSNRLLLSLLILAAFSLISLSYMSSLNLRVAALSFVGIGLGFVLFQSTFGFAGSFRAVLERGDASGFKAQAAALGV